MTSAAPRPSSRAAAAPSNNMQTHSDTSAVFAVSVHLLVGTESAVQRPIVRDLGQLLWVPGCLIIE